MEWKITREPESACGVPHAVLLFSGGVVPLGPPGSRWLQAGGASQPWPPFPGFPPWLEKRLFLLHEGCALVPGVFTESLLCAQPNSSGCWDKKLWSSLVSRQEQKEDCVRCSLSHSSCDPLISSFSFQNTKARNCGSVVVCLRVLCRSLDAEFQVLSLPGGEQSGRWPGVVGVTVSGRPLLRGGAEWHKERGQPSL